MQASFAACTGRLRQPLGPGICALKRSALSVSPCTRRRSFSLLYASSAASPFRAQFPRSVKGVGGASCIAHRFFACLPYCLVSASAPALRSGFVRRHVDRFGLLVVSRMATLFFPCNSLRLFPFLASGSVLAQQVAQHGRAESGLSYAAFFQPLSLSRSPSIGAPVSSALGAK